jgi:hypothetical protein
MRRERRSGVLEEFKGPLWEENGSKMTAMDGVSAIEQLVNECCTNPDAFHETWLRPLLAEGLSMDRVYDLVWMGTAHPN